MKEKKLSDIVISIISLIILITSGSLLGIKYSLTFNIFLIFFSSLFILLKFKLRRIQKSKLSFSIIFCVVFFLICQLKVPETSLRVVLLCLKIILFSFVIILQKNKRALISSFCNWTEKISYLSLAIYILVLITNLELYKFQIMGIESYLYLVSIFKIQILGVEFFRNSGMFWEPGLYQIFLNFCLIVLVSEGKNKNNKRIRLIITNIILTFSITGYIICCIIIFKEKIKFLFNSRKLLLNLGLASFIGMFLFQFFKEKMSTASYILRVIDIKQGIKIFKENPFLGTGYMNDFLFKEFMKINYFYERGNSNGIIIVLFTLGFPIFCIYVYGIYKFCRKNLKNYWIGFGIIILFLMNEPIQYSNFYLLLILIGYYGNYNDIAIKKHIEI